jgi:hypothetical protein
MRPDTDAHAPTGRRHAVMDLASIIPKEVVA